MSTPGFDWQAVSPYLDELLQMPEAERPSWLEALRRRDPALAACLETLLDEHRQAVQQGFLERVPGALPFERARAGDEVGAYRLLSPLGHGGMGSVWLAERSDGRFERRVAVKFLAVALTGAEGGERFKREGSILGRLAHPHIAELIDAGVSATGEPYLILENVEGVPIDQYCDETRLDIRARVRLFLDVAAAVAYAHRNLVVHRDLKPSNVLVRNDGQVKLLDFGIARLLQAGEQPGATPLLPQEARSALTPGFAAPEQITGGMLTTATDVYSLGVLLYVLLAGRHPAGTAVSATSLLRAVAEAEAPLMSDAISPGGCPAAEVDGAAVRRATTAEKLRRSLAGELDCIVAKALRRDPQERYSSVPALADDLQRYLDHQPLQARPRSFAYRARKFVRRHRAALALAALVLAASVAGLAGIVIGARTARAERDFANLQLARSEAIQDLDSFLLSDVAPSGKPFTVADLLQRAEHILAREQGRDPATHVEMLIAVGRQYAILDEQKGAERVLTSAHELSRGVADPAVRAQAGCALASTLALAGGEWSRAEALFQAGLRELPAQPQYVPDRIYCLLRGSEVARASGDARTALDRVQLAQALLPQLPYRSEVQEYRIEEDLAETYRVAGRTREASLAFQHAMETLTELGRDHTQSAGTLLNNWGVALSLLGRPVDAEHVLRQAIAISRDDRGEEAVSPMLMVNYSRALRDLGRFDEAADYAERAYAKAQGTGAGVIVNQALLMRARIYRDRAELNRSATMLDEVEPRLRRDLPPGHFALAVVAYERGRLAQSRGDLPTTLKDCSQAIGIVEAAVRAGKQGRDYLPGMLLCRAEAQLGLGHAQDGMADAARVVSLLQQDSGPGIQTSRLGAAYLVSAQALWRLGRQREAAGDFRLAVANFQDALGPNHPETRRARELAASLGPPLASEK